MVTGSDQYLHILKPECTHIHSYVCCTNVHEHICTQIERHTEAYMQICTIQTQSCTHAHKRKCTCVCWHSHTHDNTSTCVLTNIHTHTQTCKHTYIYTYSGMSLKSCSTVQRRASIQRGKIEFSEDKKFPLAYGSMIVYTTIVLS